MPTDRHLASTGTSAALAALFDFDLGTLGAGQIRIFTLFYRAAPDEPTAFKAHLDAGATIYSLGEPSSPGGRDVGKPTTFFFGYKG